MAELAALTAAVARHHRARGGVQRRGRLRVPRPRRPRHARARPGPSRDRGVAVPGRGRAGRLPRPGRRVGPALVDRGDRRDGAGRVPGQRRRALLPLQGGADGRAGAPARRGGRHRPRRQHGRSRRPPAGPAGRRRARGGVPAGRGRLQQGRRAGLVAAASACGPGTSRPPPAWPRGCPTARRSRWRCCRKVERAEAGLRALGFRCRPGAALRAHGPGGGARAGSRARCSSSGPPWSPRCGRPATSTSRSTSKACVPAT